jgi:hypothetical protein
LKDLKFNNGLPSTVPNIRDSVRPAAEEPKNKQKMIYKNKGFYSLRESPHYQKLKNRELGDIQNLEAFFSKKDIHNLCQKTCFCNSTVTT